MSCLGNAVRCSRLTSMGGTSPLTTPPEVEPNRTRLCVRARTASSHYPLAHLVDKACFPLGDHTKHEIGVPGQELGRTIPHLRGRILPEVDDPP
ncbi:hypothetical protein D3C72_359130 [compost metagenome]